jgi:hypothetical protein
MQKQDNGCVTINNVALEESWTVQISLKYDLEWWNKWKRIEFTKQNDLGYVGKKKEPKISTLSYIELTISCLRAQYGAKQTSTLTQIELSHNLHLFKHRFLDNSIQFWLCLLVLARVYISMESILYTSILGLYSPTCISSLQLILYDVQGESDRRGLSVGTLQARHVIYYFNSFVWSVGLYCFWRLLQVCFMGTGIKFKN